MIDIMKDNKTKEHVDDSYTERTNKPLMSNPYYGIMALSDKLSPIPKVGDLPIPLHKDKPQSIHDSNGII